MTVFYHNPACSKSRAALELVREKCTETGEPLHVIDYLKTPPDRMQLEMIESQLDGDWQELLRPPTDPQLAAEFSAAAVEGRDEFLVLLAQNPQCLQRPIVLRGEQTVIARPPEKALELWAEDEQA